MTWWFIYTVRGSPVVQIVAEAEFDEPSPSEYIFKLY
jgi:hypothetical protein